MIYESENLKKIFSTIVQEAEEACKDTDGMDIFWEDIWSCSNIRFISLEREYTTPRVAIDSFIDLASKHENITYFYAKELNAYIVIPKEPTYAASYFEAEIRKIAAKAIKDGLSTEELEKIMLQEEKEALEEQIRQIDKKIKK